MNDAPTIEAAPSRAAPARAGAPPLADATAFTIAALHLGGPAALLAVGGGPVATALLAQTMLWTTFVMLSRTRGFSWRDLWPGDAFAEWRLLLAAPFGAIAVALIWGSVSAAPADAPLAPAMVMAPFAVSVELAHRILPLRRRAGREFTGETMGALATALLYFAASGGGLRAALFGVTVGWVCGRLLTRTGHFPLICLTHAAAGVAMAWLGPGFR